MAVAFDAASESHTGATGSISEASFSWTHTPVGTPRGILVFTFCLAGSGAANGVTYGGVALTAVPGGYAQDTANEVGDVQAWFLGESIPTGAQTVEVQRDNNITIMYAIAASVTASDDTEVNEDGIVLLQENQTLAEQNVADGSTGIDSLRFAAVMSGLSVMPAAGASSTSGPNLDIGVTTAGLVRETTAGQGSRPVGFSSGSADDVAAVHLAVREVYTPPPSGIAAEVIGGGVGRKVIG